jgi:hypothetical protein
MVRVGRVLLIALLVTIFVAPTASAGTGTQGRFGNTLGELWTTVLELPGDQNPFDKGDPCVELDQRGARRTTVPFSAAGSTITCEVPLATKIFVTGWTSECSTLESDPYYGADEAALRECARMADSKVEEPIVTVDGRPLKLQEVETPLLNVVMPTGNIFKAIPGTTGQSVGHGWVAQINPLRIGTHTILITTGGINAEKKDITGTNTTTIVVRPSWW